MISTFKEGTFLIIIITFKGFSKLILFIYSIFYFILRHSDNWIFQKKPIYLEFIMDGIPIFSGFEAVTTKTQTNRINSCDRKTTKNHFSQNKEDDVSSNKN